MKKSLTLRLTEIEVKDLDKIKNHLKEKTYNKTVLRLIHEYVRINKLCDEIEFPKLVMIDEEIKIIDMKVYANMRVKYNWKEYDVISAHLIENLLCIWYEEWGLWDWVRMENCVELPLKK